MNLLRSAVRNFIPVIFSVALTVSTHAQWTRTEGSEGGFAAALLNTPDYMLLGLESGGVYRSTDDGVSWQFASSGLTGEGPGAYAFEILGSRVFVSTGSGISVSDNGGAAWTPANVGLPPLGAYVVGFALRGGAVFCGISGRGVYHSTDSGATWSGTPGSPADTNVSSIFATPAFLFVGTEENGVFRSSDGGASWQPASSGLASGDGMRILSFAAATGTIIVGTRGGAYRSTDNGDGWTLAASGLNSSAVSALASVGTDYLAGTFGSGAYRSTDGGVNWIPSSQGWTGGNVRTFCTRAGAIFGGNYGDTTVYRSTDGGIHWTAFGSGITSELLYALAAHGNRVYSGAYGGLHFTSDNGATWTTPPELYSRAILSLCIREGRVFAGTSGSGPYASTDSGASWTAANGGLTSFSSRSIAALTFDSASMYAGTNAGVYRSSDNGTSWLPAKIGLTDTLVTALCAVRSRLYAGTSTGMYMSTNSGSSWTALTSGLPSFRVGSIVNIDSTMLVAYELGGNPSVYKSTDWGLSWSPVSNGLASNAVIQTLCVVGRDLFGGTGMQGVWLSTDRGENWSDISDGLCGPGLKIAAMTSSGGSLFSGASKGGIWRRPLSQEVSVKQSASGVSVRCRLEQNYPNPFNPGTTIRYEVSGLSHVRLGLYDILGREVALLVNERKEAGTYEITFSASGMSSGVYIYRLMAGDFVQARRFVLLK